MAGTIRPCRRPRNVLSSWRDTGGHTLLIFSGDLFSDNWVGDWALPETDAFLPDDVGAAGGAVDGDLNDRNYTATGLAGTAFASVSFAVGKDDRIASTTDVINPASETDALVTVTENPDLVLTAAQAVPGRRWPQHIGAMRGVNQTDVDDAL